MDHRRLLHFHLARQVKRLMYSVAMLPDASAIRVSRVVPIGMWMLLVSPVTLGARLVWNPNPETDVAGYEVLVGTSSRNYTKTLLAGLNTYMQLDGYEDGAQYYFAVVAYNQDGLRSLPSDEVSYGNRPPRAVAKTVSTTQDQQVAVILEGIDPEGKPLRYVVTSKPVNGKLKGTPPNLTYQPMANFQGTDTFRFKVNDGLLDSPVSDVTVRVSSENNLTTHQIDGVVAIASPPDPLISWNFENFTPSQLADPLISSPMATPMNDGVPNILKFALGRPALTAMSGSPVHIVTTTTGTRPVFEFQRRRDLGTRNLLVEVSATLKGDWSSDPAKYEMWVQSEGGNMQKIRVRPPASSLKPDKWFIRLKVQ